VSRATNWKMLGGVGAAAVYAAVRLHAATAASPVIAPDSFDYARQSHVSIFSGAFWGSQHPPLLPLLWKLDPGAATVAPATRFLDVRPLVLLNVAVGVACWLALALVASSFCRRPATRSAAFVLVLLASLSPDVAGWDAALLSESLALSTTALLAATIALYVRRPSRAHGAALAATVVASCATRDTALILCAFLVGALVLLVRQRRSFLVAGLTVGAAIVLWGNHASDQRWKIPVRSSLAYAIVVDGAGPWLAQHGMPVSSLTPTLLLDRPTAAFETDPRARALRTWLDGHGRATWYRYLAEHPGYAAWPLRELPAEVDGDLALNAPYLEASAVLRFSPYRHGAAFWATLVLAVLAAVAIRRRVVLGLGAATVGAGMVTILAVHNLDPFDVQRHLIATQLSLRIVLFGLVLLGVERAADGALALQLEKAVQQQLADRLERVAAAGRRLQHLAHRARAVE
jgi:hypothetical protein